MKEFTITENSEKIILHPAWWEEAIEQTTFYKLSPTQKKQAREKLSEEIVKVIKAYSKYKTE